ncbi:MAG: peroxide stress protein YaaA [Zetaproteobacteria bacterium]|nr:MAG: peroxide stress protein YaaA [Zetaproteobacteria bacterium]
MLSAMLMMISPAKKLDVETPAPVSAFTVPEFLDASQELANSLRMMSAKELGGLMNISPKLAELNARRYRYWHTPFTPENAKQALFAFRGDVYAALDADSLSESDVAFTQDHLRILSGLYGLLRPLDLMQAYRLEMGTRLANARGRDLYAFWGNTITDALNQALSGEPEPVLINLASNEYSKAVQSSRLIGRVINVQFREQKDDGYKIIGIHAKKARGLMSRFVIQNRIDDPEDIKQFNLADYRYRTDMSTGSEWVFAR